MKEAQMKDHVLLKITECSLTVNGYAFDQKCCIVHNQFFWIQVLN
ncbi:hypothetical protein N500_0274, partial [Wolbachia pipientis wUni]